jgi:hypothetical protein
MEEGKKEKEAAAIQTIRWIPWLKYLCWLSKLIHDKFQKCYLFMGKASPHYTCKKVINILKITRTALLI